MEKSKAVAEYEQKVGTAETRARAIIDDAVKTAETKKREALLRQRRRPLKIRMNLKRNSVKEGELQQQEQRS